MRTGALVFAVLMCSACTGEQSHADGLATSGHCDARRCEILLDTIATIGADGDSIWPVFGSRVVHDARGRFLVSPLDHDGVIGVYSPSGALLGTFGRAGNGPGEYDTHSLFFMRGAADTISIVDLTNQRRTFVDTAGNPTRMHPVPIQPYGMIESGGRLLAHADIRSPEKAGYLLHEITADGTVGESYVEQQVFKSERTNINYVRSSPRGGVWIAERNRYAVYRYDENLTLIDSVVPLVKWFAPHGGDVTNPFAERPLPVLSAVREDTTGLLWVLLTVPDKSWSEVKLDYSRMPTIADVSSVRDWIIDVIDLRAKTRIASARFDTPIGFGKEDDLLYSGADGTSGQVSITASRPRLAAEKGN